MEQSLEIIKRMMHDCQSEDGLYELRKLYKIIMQELEGAKS